jgi:hypothetical protein
VWTGLFVLRYHRCRSPAPPCLRRAALLAVLLLGVPGGAGWAAGAQGTMFIQQQGFHAAMPTPNLAAMLSWRPFRYGYRHARWRARMRRWVVGPRMMLVCIDPWHSEAARSAAPVIPAGGRALVLDPPCQTLHTSIPDTRLRLLASCLRLRLLASCLIRTVVLWSRWPAQQCGGTAWIRPPTTSFAKQFLRRLTGGASGCLVFALP